MDKFVVFIFGAIIGSFLNVCIHRLPRNESLVKPGSYCPNCRNGIRWHDNIPILSYIALAGKCRFCKAKISFRYPLVEILTASLLTALFMNFGMAPKFFAYSIMTCSLIIATFVDFEIQEIPDEVSLGGIVVGLALAFIFPSIFDAASRFNGISGSFIGAAVGGASIYAIGVLGKIAFKKEAMGGGDVKLMAMIGAFLGWKLVLLIFFVAPLFGSVIGIILKMKDGRETIPYGPFLSLAAIIAVFFGTRILSIFFHGIF